MIEYDLDALFTPITNMTNLMIIMLTVIVLIAIISGFFISQSISKPIIKLRDKATIMSKGNLNIKIDTKSKDEIGELAKDFKHMTDNLKKQQDNLENKVSERTKELSDAKRRIELQNIELEKINKLKSDFLNTTSHELRTPMTAMKGYLQMLIKNKFGRINKDQNKALEVIHRNTERLDRLVGDILDTSRLESGTMKFEPKKTNVKKLIDEIIETMQAVGDVKKIKIKRDIKESIPDLIIDKTRFSQVIVNLINNAIKFSPEGSVINLKVKNDKDGVLFEVQDFGIGVSKDDQNKIFNVFYQVDSGTDRTFGGTGLGLTISRGIVLGHGGDIWVESQKGKGSSFKFTIPKKPIMDAEETFRKINIFDSTDDSSKNISDSVENEYDIGDKVNLLLEKKGI